MKLSDFLDGVGRPVAYYPRLAGPLGSVNAAILFGQLYYWMRRGGSDLGIHKTMQELRDETGLSRSEQESARKALRRCGVLVETHKRLEHKIYFRLDLDRLEQLIEQDAEASNPNSSNAENQLSPMQESCTRESEKPASGSAGKLRPRIEKTYDRGSANPASVNGVEITSEITSESSSNAREAEPVDNSDADVAAAADSKKPPPKSAEAELTELLIELERARGKTLTVNRNADRAAVLVWVGRGVTADQLRAAHAAAVAARDRDTDARPTYVAFVDSFLGGSPVQGGAGAPDGRWFESPDSVDAKGFELGVRIRRADEDWRYYRVLVARAAREPAAIEAVLNDAQRFNSTDLYQFARATFGDALLPVDDFPS